MLFFLLIDPETGRAIGASKTDAPDYAPHAHEVACAAEQAAAPTAWMVRDGAIVAAPPVEAPAPPAAPVLTSKLDFFRRMTEAEADAVVSRLATATVRDQRMFEAATVLNHADADFARLRESLVDLFGEARAAALLAPSAGA